jgi:uncharacterized membrane protein YhhN
MGRERILNLLYVVILFTHLLAITFHLEIISYITTSLLTFILAVYFFTGTQGIPTFFRLLILLALFFSGLGDIFQLYLKQGQLFFISGLVSFLLSLISYIAFFLKIRYSNYPLPSCQWAFIFIATAIVLGFLFFLMPYLGKMTLPVLLFAVVASIALQAVMHAFRLRDQPVGWYALAGALLYMLSSGIVAIHYFYQPVPGGEILIMLTYGLAQWGLVTGGLRYLQIRRGYAIR